MAYRTSAVLISEYSAREVARVLQTDFAAHGAPLVLRADNASAHDAPEVAQVLREHEVLMLHGPAYYPQYNGQHERQNREHRAWLSYAALGSDAETEEELASMLQVLNGSWLRKSLGWQPAAAAWGRRRALHVDRAALRAEAERRAARLRERGLRLRLAARLAIEQTLEDRGLLRRIARGWC